jgi:hypothetical protein
MGEAQGGSRPQIVRRRAAGADVISSPEDRADRSTHVQAPGRIVVPSRRTALSACGSNGRRDLHVAALSDDDRDMENGWRMIPVPPTGDGGWIIVDDCSDRKTGWVRR